MFTDNDSSVKTNCTCPDACNKTTYGNEISYTSFSELSMDSLLSDVHVISNSYQKAVNTAHRYM